jgi:hypothetical protein
MYAEDIAVWSNKRGDTEIECTYGVKFTIKQDGTLWLGNLVPCHTHRCHWTEHIDNTFHGAARTLLPRVFENVMDKHRPVV